MSALLYLGAIAIGSAGLLVSGINTRSWRGFVGFMLIYLCGAMVGAL